MRRLVLPVLLAALSLPLCAQAPSGRGFDVASIKIDRSGGRGSRGGTAPGGRFTLTNVTAVQMITQAFRVKTVQVIGGPGWINEERYDVAAKMPDGSYDPQTGATPNSSVGPFLKSLLEERFHLVAHNDTRELTDASLVLARADGKLGPNLKPAAPEDYDCKNFDLRTFRPDPTDPFKAAPPCGNSASTLKNGAAHIVVRGQTMDQIAAALAGQSMPLVTNDTGLQGAYNYVLEYGPEPTAADAAAIPDLPTRTTALQEQLGLKIVLRKEQTPVVVIDHIEHPTED